jgi:hypothetical protein
MVMGTFLSFFLVLFVNQTNGRFLEMYGFAKACSGRIQDVAGLAKTLLLSVHLTIVTYFLSKTNYQINSIQPNSVHSCAISPCSGTSLQSGTSLRSSLTNQP